MSRDGDLTGPDGPWVHEIGRLGLSRLLSSTSASDGVRMLMDGRRMRTVDDLFQQYVREFRLPEYFGWNWAAFDECMTDLAWMPANGYLTVIDSADQVLADELDDRATSLRHLRGIGRYWSRAFALGPAWGRGEVAFHTVLVDSDDVGTVGD